MPNNNITIPVPQIARICNVTEESVRQWCRSGWLKAHKNEGNQEWIVNFKDLAEHFEITPKHYNMLTETSPTRLRDQKLKKDLQQEIKQIRRWNR